MSPPKFAVGEIVIVTNAADWPEYDGQEVEIMATPLGHFWEAPNGRIVHAGCYWIKTGDGRSAQCLEAHLRKKPGKEDDSRQVTSWDKCLFKPNGVKA